MVAFVQFLIAAANQGKGALAGLPVAPDDAAALILTRRSARLKSHAGQWALPGGSIDSGESPQQTALRELEEEVGLLLSDDKVLGCLDDFITRSGFRITPVVIWGGNRVNLVANEEEVASIHRIPFCELLRPDTPILDHAVEGEHPILDSPLAGKAPNTVRLPATGAGPLERDPIGVLGDPALNSSHVAGIQSIVHLQKLAEAGERQVTHGQADLVLIGPFSMDLLSRLCGLDFHSKHFPNLTAKQSSVAKTRQLILRRDLGEHLAFSLIGARSLADYLWQMIFEAGQDLNIAPVGQSALQRLGETVEPDY